MSGRPGQTFFLRPKSERVVNSQEKLLTLVRTVFVFGALAYLGIIVFWGQETWFANLRMLFWGGAVFMFIPLVIIMIVYGGKNKR